MRFFVLAACLLSIGSVLGHEPEAQLPFEHPHAHEAVEGHLHTGWDSRYFSEGRDSLDGDSLWTSSFELGWEHLTAGAWYGLSPDQDYDELQLAFALSQQTGDLGYYLGYTHLRFPFLETHDHEIGAGLTWAGLPLSLELSTDVYHSFDADGAFALLGLGREFDVTDKLTLGLTGQLGMNQGYVADGHDGANHFALQLGAQLALTENWALSGHLTGSLAMDRDPAAPGDDLLTDFFHGGVGLQGSF